MDSYARPVALTFFSTLSALAGPSAQAGVGSPSGDIVGLSPSASQPTWPTPSTRAGI